MRFIFIKVLIKFFYHNIIIIKNIEKTYILLKSEINFHNPKTENLKIMIP